MEAAKAPELGHSSEAEQAEIKARYRQRMEQGLQANAPPEPDEPVPKKRGRKKQCPAENMLDRLKVKETMAYLHHQKALEYFKSQQQAEPQVLAAIVIGSVARGDAGEMSDIDLLVVLDQPAYLEQKATGQLRFDEVYPVDQHDVDLGGAFINLDYLSEVDRRGPEPARFAFQDAFVLFSRIPELIDLIPRLAVYQEHERLEKMTSFSSQLPVHFSFMELADLSQNAYLLSETAVEIVLFGGRLILAYNRMLYPNRKLFMHEFARAPEKPDGIIQLAETLLRKPGIATARAFCDPILTFKEWPQPPEGVMARFVRDRDNFWLNGMAALGES